ncbi:hypothetical protein C6497_04670 [Candidatus Poribacteria bacterium]|nr:MAG: hypothetical protein C6497_04670 [Candidatus Poribacteria bacterium]
MKHLLIPILICMIFISIGCSSHLIDTFSEDGYNFRKTRWGMTPAQVELSEVGSTVVQRTGRHVVYYATIDGVSCKVIYIFKDNRLRTAGYITKIPVKNADNLLDKCYEKHGEPHYVVDEKDLTWKLPNSVIYANLYKSYVKVTDPTLW